MSVSPLKNIVLPAVLLAGAVFSSLTLPLAQFGSEPVEIQMNQEPLFDGKLKDVAAPYVGLAALLSLGSGVASIAISGWRLSARKSEQIQGELSNLQQQLQEKDARLEAVLLSTPKLEESGLSFFLQDEVTSAPAQTVSSSGGAQKQPAAIGHSTVQATAPLAAAQSYMGFNRSTLTAESAQQQPVAESLPPTDRIEVLQAQLKQMMTQLETLQGSLQPQPQPTTRQEDKSRNAASSVEPTHRYQTINSHWAVQPMAS